MLLIAFGQRDETVPLEHFRQQTHANVASSFVFICGVLCLGKLWKGLFVGRTEIRIAASKQASYTSH